MDCRHCPVPLRSADWPPLVSQARWDALARALSDRPELRDDLRAALTQLSPGVRGTLIDNVMMAVGKGLPSARAAWTALAITDRQGRLGLAVALGRLEVFGEDSQPGEMRPLPPRQ